MEGEEGSSVSSSSCSSRVEEEPAARSSDEISWSSEMIHG